MTTGRINQVVSFVITAYPFTCLDWQGIKRRCVGENQPNAHSTFQFYRVASNVAIRVCFSMAYLILILSGVLTKVTVPLHYLSERS